MRKVTIKLYYESNTEKGRIEALLVSDILRLFE